MDLGQREHFMNLTPKAREVKANIKEWYYSKLKSLCIAKETDNKTKRQPTKWEMIFANNSSNRRMSPKYIKNSHKSALNNPTKNWAEDLTRCQYQEVTQTAIRYKKRCSISLAIKEMQIETTMRYHLTPVRITIINKTIIISVGRLWKKGTLIH